MISLDGQITLSPEIGLSYSPFTAIGANTRTEISPYSFFWGISGNVPLFKKWLVKTRVSYNKRENVRWTDRCLCPDYQYSEFRHDDINIDFSLNYFIKDKLIVGVGPLFIKKINSKLISQTDTYNEFDVGGTEFGINANTSLYVFIFWINVQYLYKITESDLLFFRKEGKSRLDLTISFPIPLSKEKGK